MGNEYSLGTPGEYYPPKTFYIVFMFLITAFMFWGTISTPDQGVRNAMFFYIGFGTVLGIIPVIFDNLTLKTFPRFDTVTIEKPMTPFLNLKIVFLFSIVLGGLLVSKILVTQQAFVPYPEFNFFQSSFGNAIMSGVYGFCENWFFFSFLFPTFYAIIAGGLKNRVIGFLSATVIVSFIFMSFHFVVYQAREDALLSTLVFAVVCITLTGFFRTIIPSDVLHFTNNFVGRAIQAGIGLFGR